MLQKIAKVFGYDPTRKLIDIYSERVAEINRLEPEFESLTDTELAQKTDEFRKRLSEGETLDELLIEAYATVREVSKRTLG
ncbi:hypothetical protein EG832_12805, partial [bacterium]|nr:hypothetical protein [bacterium]